MEVTNKSQYDNSAERNRVWKLTSCSLAVSQDENQKTNHLKCVYQCPQPLGQTGGKQESEDIVGIPEAWWDDLHDWRIVIDGFGAVLQADGEEEEESHSMLRRILNV